MLGPGEEAAQGTDHERNDACKDEGGKAWVF
jgi:hypothetical protein